MRSNGQNPKDVQTSGTAWRSHNSRTFVQCRGVPLCVEACWHHCTVQGSLDNCRAREHDRMNTLYNAQIWLCCSFMWTLVFRLHKLLDSWGRMNIDGKWWSVIGHLIILGEGKQTGCHWTGGWGWQLSRDREEGDWRQTDRQKGRIKEKRMSVKMERKR